MLAERGKEVTIFAPGGDEAAKSFHARKLTKQWVPVWSDEFEGAALDYTKWGKEENGYGGGNKIPHAALHGDFSTFNIFIDSDQTIGFDYLTNKQEPVIDNICHFLLFVDNSTYIPARRTELSAIGCRRSDAATFAKAYIGMVDWLNSGL